MSWSPPPESLLSRAELLAAGVHPRRLASAEFHRPLPRHYTPASAPAPLEVMARVLCRTLLPHAVLSHATAAEVLGWPLPLRLLHARTGVLHCRVAPSAPRRAGPGVRVHRPLPRMIQRARGIPAASTGDVLCDIAPALTHDELVAVMDHIIGPCATGAFLTRESLGTAIAAMAGADGVARVRAALPEVRERVESPRETHLRLLLLREGFAEPEIDVHVRAEGCRAPYRLDLAYPEARIAIEYDGDWHRTDRDRFQRDRRKDDVLHEHGWRVVRVTAADLRDPRALIARLEHLGAPRRTATTGRRRPR